MKNSAELDNVDIAEYAQLLELEQELIGCLTDQLSMTDQPFGSAEILEQFVSLAAVFQHRVAMITRP